ncbi:MULTISPECIES: WD40 repeat domain-containing protein [unclassified Kitasatospora]|uniref:WD40 repeat domain-containing protein n=1 Tax=unclassified Kitasatospora TaxID=2633591 RepID=UPI002475E97A|nr:WD40 repeat domain-containing protein [Kitasatospora sp. MAP12-44]
MEPAGSPGSATSLGPLDLPNLPSPVALRTAALRPGDQTAATGRDDGTVELWTSVAPAIPGQLTNRQSNSAPGSSFGDGGRALVTQASDGSAALWDVTDRLNPALASTLPAPWSEGGFLSDDHTLLTTDSTGSSIGLWNAADPRHPVPEATLARPGPASGTCRWTLTPAAASWC